MKSALGILSGLVVLLVAMFILKKRKKCSTCSSKEMLINKTKSSDQEKQPLEIKPVVNTAVNIESTTVNSPITDISTSVAEINNIQAFAAPQPAEITENDTSGFPQDSILKRHYFHHLCTMIETLAPQCPTDSVLRRHYYMLLLTQIDQCLNDKQAVDRLISAYQLATRT
jgi:hypothetical protein